MEIKIKSLKFDADEKLLAYVEKKVTKLSKFHEGAGTAEVTMSLQPDHENKNVKLKIHVPGAEMIIDRSARSFEEAVTDCVDAMKEKLTRAREKEQEA